MLMILMIHLGKWVILLKKKEGGGAENNFQYILFTRCKFRWFAFRKLEIVFVSVIQYTWLVSVVTDRQNQMVN